MTSRGFVASRALRRRHVLGAGALFVASGALAACSAASAPAPAARGPASIRLSIWGDVPDLDVYTNIIDDFQQVNPTIKVGGEQYGTAGTNYYEKLQTLFAADEAPDVNYLQGWIWQPYALNGLLLPLDSLLSKDKALTGLSRAASR